MESHTPDCNQDAPEVKADVPAKDAEDPDSKLNSHPEWKGSEYCNERPTIINH